MGYCHHVNMGISTRCISLLAVICLAIAGTRGYSSFALLHQMQARSLTDAFAARTWFREQVFRPEPADYWLANDGKAVEAQLILLQTRLLVDFKKLLGMPTPE